MKKLSYWPTFLLGGSLCMAVVIPFSASSEEAFRPNERPVNDAAKIRQDVDKAELDQIGKRDLDQKRYRMDSQGQGELNEETRNDIKDTLVSLVEYAVAGDIEDVIDHLAQGDEDRLMSENVSSDEALEHASETFETNWKASNKDSFDNVFNRDSLKVEFLSGMSDNWGRVQVSDGTESVELKVVNEGILMDSWKIDAPDSLTRQRLQGDIQATLADSTVQLNSQALALKVLKCLGQPSGTAMNEKTS